MRFVVIGFVAWAFMTVCAHGIFRDWVAAGIWSVLFAVVFAVGLWSATEAKRGEK